MTVDAGKQSRNHRFADYIRKFYVILITIGLSAHRSVIRTLHLSDEQLRTWAWPPVDKAES